MQTKREQELIPACDWQPWQWQAPEGFWLRGVHTVPRGLPVLHFIHGNSYCGRIYEPMWQYLTVHFDVFLHDAQGHGDSDFGGRFVGWKRSAELAKSVWQQHRGQFRNVPHIGMGHSFGGVLTSVVSAHDNDFFVRLVLLDLIIMPPRMTRIMEPLKRLGLYKFNPFAKKAKRRRSQWASAQEALTRLTGRGMFKGWSNAAMLAYVTHGMTENSDGTVSLKCNPAREAEIFSSYMPGLWKTLPQLAAPTFILYGDQTYPFVRDSLGKLGDLLPQLHVEEVAGGHCFMQETPADTAIRVREHLTRSL